MDSDLFLQQFGHLAQGEGGIKKLRDMILRLAVQGKLVEQNPSDEPAEVLLQKIGSERKKQEKEGKIKKRFLAKYNNAFLQQPLPRSWRLVCIDDVVLEMKSGGTPSKANAAYWTNDNGIFWASVKDLKFGQKYILSTQDKITSLALIDAKTKIAKTGEFLICTRMGLGKISICACDMAFNQDLKAVSISSFIEANYFYLFFQTLTIKGTGTTVDGIVQEKLLAYPFPLPPLAEQKRIVAKVDELMALCDKLEEEQNAQRTLKKQAVQSTLHHLTSAESPVIFGSSLNILERTFGNWFDDLATVKHLRATILQLAVQGKLIPQNPDDKPISLKGEKHKNLNWKYLKFLDVVSDPKEGFRRGPFGSALRKDFFVPNGIKVYEQKHAIQKSYKLGNYYIDNNKFAQMRAFEVIPGDFIVSCSGTLGEIYQIPSDAPKGIINQALLRLRIDERIFDHKYFEKYFYSPEFRAVLIEHAPGSAQVNMAGLKILKNLMLPVPPLAEQKRIVAKVDELMALCDQLEAHITQAQTLNTHLMDSLIHRMTEAA